MTEYEMTFGTDADTDKIPVPIPVKNSDKDIKRLVKEKDRMIRHQDRMLRDLTPKKYDIIKDPGKIYDLTKWIRRIKNRLFPDRTYLINMELRNGMHKSFLILSTQDKFYFMEGRYIIDDDLKYYNISCGCYALDYHQDFAMPVRRKISPNTLKSAMKEVQGDDMKIDNATNPSTLDRFIESEMAKKVMEGQELATMLKRLFAVGLITMFAVVIHMIVFMKKTGMLDNVKLPGT